MPVSHVTEPSLSSIAVIGYENKRGNANAVKKTSPTIPPTLESAGILVEVPRIAMYTPEPNFRTDLTLGALVMPDQSDP